MKKLLVLLILTAGLASAATKSDLKDSLVATGDYLYVSDPVSMTSPFGSSVAKYKIVLLIESSTDTLVAYTTQTYIWVLDDGLATEQAFWNRNNLVNPPAAVLTFQQRVETFMVNQSISGYITDTGVLGNVEWATVTRYTTGSDGNHVAQQTVWVTRTDGTTWDYKIVD
jgi:hypothetical protein